LKNEPAVQRAVRNKFIPYKQVAMRLRALQETGHPLDKVELRVIGGTWSYYPKKYQQWFVGECFRACNRHSVSTSPLTPSVNNIEREQKKNERARCRVVGIAVETRPDYIDTQEIKWMRELGITKVELGVQTIYDDILKLNQRGHSVATTIAATRLLKNAGFKVAYQMMPGLYGSSFKKDLAMFREIFTNPDFKPDYLKIYPLALVKNTKLYNLYKQGKFKPYNQKELTKLLVEIKKQIPRWCRVERIIRDIPSSDIVEGGSSILNLREIVVKEMARKGAACQCIRCREVGANYDAAEKLYLFREDYEASNGIEVFLTFENKKRAKLYALLRLRLPKELGSFSEKEPSSFYPPVAAIIRDLHVYGQMAQISQGPTLTKLGHRESQALAQHRGLGKKLMAQAEKIARQNGFSKVAVISAIGVRPYYRKLGYRLQKTYMVKILR